VVSLIQLSTLIMQSSPSSAASSRSPPGVDRTGFPATVNSARICPSPGVAISSARHDTGTWPSTSGAPRTRLVHRPKLAAPPSSPGMGIVDTDHADGRGNISPPGTSKCRVRMLTTSTSQLASVPNSWLQSPIRP
jgi:hypothetical protein